MQYFSGKGDQGLSKMINGGEISKGDPIFSLLGAIDELNAFIGFAICAISDKQTKSDLYLIQITFSKIMGQIAGVKGPYQNELKITESLNWLEDKIKQVGDTTNHPAEFTYPGKTEAGARLDVCRTVARRVERIAVSFDVNAHSLIEKYYPYLNRVSTYFFVLRLKFDN